MLPLTEPDSSVTRFVTGGMSALPGSELPFVSGASRSQILDDIDDAQQAVRRNLAIQPANPQRAQDPSDILQQTKKNKFSASLRSRIARREVQLLRSQINEFEIGIHKCDLDLKLGNRILQRVENAYEARVAEHRVQIAAIKAQSALLQPEEDVSSDADSQESQTQVSAPVSTEPSPTEEIQQLRAQLAALKLEEQSARTAAERAHDRALQAELKASAAEQRCQVALSRQADGEVSIKLAHNQALIETERNKHMNSSADARLQQMERELIVAQVRASAAERATDTLQVAFDRIRQELHNIRAAPQASEKPARVPSAVKAQLLKLDSENQNLAFELYKSQSHYYRLMGQHQLVEQRSKIAVDEESKAIARQKALETQLSVLTTYDRHQRARTLERISTIARSLESSDEPDSIGPQPSQSQSQSQSQTEKSTTQSFDAGSDPVSWNSRIAQRRRLLQSMLHILAPSKPAQAVTAAAPVRSVAPVSSANASACTAFSDTASETSSVLPSVRTPASAPMPAPSTVSLPTLSVVTSSVAPRRGGIAKKNVGLTFRPIAAHAPTPTITAPMTEVNPPLEVPEDAPAAAPPVKSATATTSASATKPQLVRKKHKLLKKKVRDSSDDSNEEDVFSPRKAPRTQSQPTPSSQPAPSSPALAPKPTPKPVAPMDASPSTNSQRPVVVSSTSANSQSKNHQADQVMVIAPSDDTGPEMRVVLDQPPVRVSGDRIHYSSMKLQHGDNTMIVKVGASVLFRPQPAYCPIIDEAIRTRVPYKSIEQRPYQVARVDSIYQVAESTQFFLDVRLLASAYEARLSAGRAAELWGNELLLLPASLTISATDVAEMFFCWFTEEVFMSSKDLDARLSIQLDRAQQAGTALPNARPYFCRYFFARELKHFLPYSQASI